MKFSDNDDTRFFTDVHLLAGKLVLVVAIHLIGITRQTHNRVPHNQHKMGITQAMSNPV
jgi:hypothetical protein